MINLNLLLIVALGGAAGAVARFSLVALLRPRFSNEILSLPLSTLVVNIAGSFTIGLVYILLSEKLDLGPEWRHLLMVGFLAAFTTFSTFSLDAVFLLQSGHYGYAIAYIIASVSLCILACYLAILLARML